MQSIDETNIPRYALYRGKKVRILGYEEGRFRILERDDTQRSVTRDQIIFLREKKNA
jgi:hypothetical protein